jgi:integrase/recombinase XerC
MEAPPAEPPFLRDHAMLELLYGSGIRVSELCSLNLMDVDLGRRTARVLGKGRKQRVVPLGSKCVAALNAYKPRRCEVVSVDTATIDPVALFVTRRGARIAPRAVQRLVQSYGELGWPR